MRESLIREVVGGVGFEFVALLMKGALFLLSLRIAPLGRAVFPPVIIEVLDARALKM